MREYSRIAKLMGSSFKLSVVENDPIRAEKLLQVGIDEIVRIEELLSEFKSTSEVSKINQSAGSETLKVNQECYALIERSLAISELTNGCFDITVGALKKIYDFKNAEFKMPSRVRINETLNRVGYKKVRLNPENRSLSFDHENLRISFAAIGKGYASDRVKAIWKQEGVFGGYVNASGDLNTFGCKPDGTEWRVGIANPDKKEEMLLFIPGTEVSVATSGDYEQFFEYKGRRYSHNINPHTGRPLSGIKSVSIVSPSAELSDALATAVYVMGRKEGINFVDQLPQTHAIIIDDQNNLFLSKDLEYDEIGS